MEKVGLTNTELQVSQLCLGTADFGTKRSREEAFRQMDVFLDGGGNFIDTAHVYGDWACEEKGCSEKVIGEWLAGKRDKVILSTKGCHPPINDMECSRVDVHSLREDVEESLRCLKTDYIDLYFLHRDNPQVPAGELLEALEDEVRRGNLRYYGCSNWSLERLKEADRYAKEHVLRGFACNQMMFVLADVVPETLVKPQLTILDGEYYRYEKETQLSFMAYMCMAGGYFSKRMAGKPVSAQQKERYHGDANEAILRKLKLYVSEGYQVTDFLFSYVKMAGFPSIPIAGFGSEAQLRQGLDCIDREVPEEIMKDLISLKRTQSYQW